MLALGSSDVVVALRHRGGELGLTLIAAGALPE